VARTSGSCAGTLEENAAHRHSGIAKGATSLGSEVGSVLAVRIFVAVALHQEPLGLLVKTLFGLERLFQGCELIVWHGAEFMWRTRRTNAIGFKAGPVEALRFTRLSRLSANSDGLAEWEEEIARVLAILKMNDPCWWTT
jgi:hypothetical protein